MKQANGKNTNTAWFHLFEVSEIVQVMETECAVIVLGAEGRGEEELFFNRYRISVMQD